MSLPLIETKKKTKKLEGLEKGKLKKKRWMAVFHHEATGSIFNLERQRRKSCIRNL